MASSLKHLQTVPLLSSALICFTLVPPKEKLNILICFFKLYLWSNPQWLQIWRSQCTYHIVFHTFPFICASSIPSSLHVLLHLFLTQHTFSESDWNHVETNFLKDNAARTRLFFYAKANWTDSSCLHKLPHSHIYYLNILPYHCHKLLACSKGGCHCSLPSDISKACTIVTISFALRIGMKCVEKNIDAIWENVW